MSRNGTHAPKPDHALVKVPFHGDRIEALQTPDGKILVHFKKVCDSLGLDPWSQLRKMRTREWCEIVDLTAPDQRGRPQSLAMIGHESLPMWLATVNATNVRENAKRKLVRYQKEAKAVLAAWFLGESSDRPDLAREMAAGVFHVSRVCGRAVADPVLGRVGQEFGQEPQKREGPESWQATSPRPAALHRAVRAAPRPIHRQSGAVCSQAGPWLAPRYLRRAKRRIAVVGGR